MQQRTCSVAGCDGVTGVPGTARGLCNKHYNRWRRHGDVTIVRQGRPPSGAKHPLWKGSAASYTALHNRVYRLRGKASHCERCGLDAPRRRYEWATVHGTDGTDPFAHYLSLCAPCHRTYDLAKLTVAQRAEIRQRVASGESMKALAREFRIHPSVISRGLNLRGTKWGSSK